VRITLPSHHLQVIRGERYEARVFPRSQVAGIVRGIKGKTARRLMPLYYFKLEVPAQFYGAAFTKLDGPDPNDPRAVFLTDPYQRFVNVLYFPEKDKARDTVVLQFGR